MYLGRIVEMAPAGRIYLRRATRTRSALLSAVPIPDPVRQRARKRIMLQGDVPSPIDPPSGCVFRTRCFQAQERCAVEVPPLTELEPGHFVACHFPVAEPPSSVGVESVTADIPVTATPPTAPPPRVATTVGAEPVTSDSGTGSSSAS